MDLFNPFLFCLSLSGPHHSVCRLRGLPPRQDPGLRQTQWRHFLRQVSNTNAFEKNREVGRKREKSRREEEAGEEWGGKEDENNKEIMREGGESASGQWYWFFCFSLLPKDTHFHTHMHAGDSKCCPAISERRMNHYLGVILGALVH